MSRLYRLDRWRFLRGSLLAKLNPAEDKRRRLHRDVQLFFLPFQSRKDDARCRLFSAGLSRTCGSMKALVLSASPRRISRSELLLDQPTGYLSNKFKNGQQFFTRRANH